jgi:hypothetical protein
MSALSVPDRDAIEGGEVAVSAPPIIAAVDRSDARGGGSFGGASRAWSFLASERPVVVANGLPQSAAAGKSRLMLAERRKQRLATPPPVSTRRRYEQLPARHRRVRTQRTRAPRKEER